MQPRQRILDSASVLFHKQGYNSTGINQIIEEAKVAKASFYQHFRSKEDLCVAFLQIRHTYWFEQLHAFIHSRSTSSSTEKVLACFDFIAFMNEKEHFRGCSFLNILSEIPSDNIKILAVIQSHKKDLRDFFGDLLGEEYLADHVYLLFESAIIESQLFGDQWPVVKSKHIIQSLLAYQLNK